MLMFTFHLVLLLALVVFGVGMVMLHFGGHKGGSSSLKIGGLVVAIGGAASVLCISYYGIKYWQQGAYETPHPMMHQMMMRGMMGPKGMMGKGMMGPGMMGPGMMGPNQMQEPDGQQAPEPGPAPDKDEHGH